MNKLAVVLLAALASKGVLAGEVGANNPQVAEPATLAYAALETGADNSEWALGPVNLPVTAAQHKKITGVTEAMNSQVINQLYVELYRSLEQEL
ncbi:MAG TPA: hypothetical protein VIC26_10900 [Marinagarivorans sp.]